MTGELTETEIIARPANPIVAVPALPAIAQRAARWYRPGPRRGPAIWIVIHCTEGAEGTGKAQDVAQMLATIPPRAAGGKPRSAHLVIDTQAVVQCVPFEHEAWHAGAHGNTHGEGIELCGRAEQTHAEWLDAASLPMLALAARIVRWRCDTLRIPLELRTHAELLALQPGVTTHAEIARAFPLDTDHSDPGPGFPLNEFMQAVRAA
jgi:hypothetical protein